MRGHRWEKRSKGSLIARGDAWLEIVLSILGELRFSCGLHKQQRKRSRTPRQQKTTSIRQEEQTPSSLSNVIPEISRNKTKQKTKIRWKINHD